MTMFAFTRRRRRGLLLLLLRFLLVLPCQSLQQLTEFTSRLYGDGICCRYPRVSSHRCSQTQQQSSSADIPISMVADSCNEIRSTKETKIISVKRNNQNEYKLSKNERHEKRWKENFQLLVEFKAMYGHVNVPQRPTKSIPDADPRLGIFCRNLRSQYKYLQQDETKHLSFLTEERIQQLDSVGFVWNPRENIWYTRYEELCEFSKEFGHTNVPIKYKANQPLANWVSTQRTRLKNRSLSARQVELLEEIGFQRDPKDDRWWQMFNDLVKFKEEFGHYKVPPRYAKNPELNTWLIQVRRRCREYELSVAIDGTTEGVHVSGLNPERLVALRKIAFYPLPTECSIRNNED